MQQCKELGLEWTPTRRKSKQPFIDALQAHYLVANKVPLTKGLKFRLSMKSPMLARIVTDLKPSEINYLYESDNVVFDKKHNGLRMIVSHFDNENWIEVYSRNLSVTDFLPVPYTSKIYWGAGDFHALPEFVLDTEIISTNPMISTVMGNRGVITETELQAIAAMMALNDNESLRLQQELNPIKFMVFDCLYWNSLDLRQSPFIKRRDRVITAVDILNAHGFTTFSRSPVNGTRKEEFLEWIWANGGEGVIAKRLDGMYKDDSNRSRDGWIKIKRTTTGTLGDTIDGFITGFELGKEGRGFENYVGSLYISINLEKEDGSTYVHEIARVANVPLEKRKEITVEGEKGPELDKSYYNKVVEVEGQAVSSRARRLTHPRLLRFRDDKAPHECTMKESDLNRMIM